MLITSKFAGRCKSCGGAYAVGARVEWSRDGGTKHGTAAECQSSSKSSTVAPLVDAAPIVALLQGARDRGLTWPKVRVMAPDGRRVLLSLAGADSRNPGAVYLKLDGEYYGMVAKSGEVRGDLAGDAAMRLHLAAIAADPAGMAREYARQHATCSFCGLELTADNADGSIDVGYGPVCAARYGLPHKSKPTPKRAPSAVVSSATSPEFDGTLDWSEGRA